MNRTPTWRSYEQRQIYQAITEAAAQEGSQLLMATHSEVVLNEAGGRHAVTAFVGVPHRMDGRSSQVFKALAEIGFESYLQAAPTRMGAVPGGIDRPGGAARPSPAGWSTRRRTSWSAPSSTT